MQTWRAISFPNTGGVRVSPCTLGMDYLHPDGHTTLGNAFRLYGSEIRPILLASDDYTRFYANVKCHDACARDEMLSGR